MAEGNAGAPDISPPPTFGQLRGDRPVTPNIPQPTFGGPFGNYTGGTPRPSTAGIRGPSAPPPIEPPDFESAVQQVLPKKQGNQMPHLGGNSAGGAAGGEAGGVAGGAEAGSAAADAAGAAVSGGAASIVEALGFL